MKCCLTSQEFKQWRTCPVCETKWNWGMRCRAEQDPFDLCTDCRTKEMSWEEMNERVKAMLEPCS